MALNDAQPVNTGTTTAFSFTSDQREADPFDETNITWTEVDSSIGEDWDGFTISLTTQYQRFGPFLVATGAAGSESIIAVVPCNPFRSQRTFTMYVPIPISSGTRIAVGASTSQANTIQGQIEGDPAANHSVHPTFTRLDSGPYNLENNSNTYGRAPEVDCGATAHTKSGYVELSWTSGNGNNNLLNGDSLDHDYPWFGIVSGRFGDTSWLDATFLYDIATGAAASETIQFADRFCHTRTYELGNDAAAMFETDVFGSGDRVSCRAQCSITDSSERVFSPYLLGLR